MKVLVIIPAYNEEKNIESVLGMLQKTVPEYDYLVVNDCSRDYTKRVLRSAHAEFIDFPVNLGIGGAVQAGYIYAYENGYDVAVQIDGDGQHDPAYLPKLIMPIERGEADVVIGSRFIDYEGFQSTVLRRMGITTLSTWMKMISGKKIADVTSGFRAVNRKMIKLYAQNYDQDYPEPEAIVTATRHGAVVKEVAVKMHERQNGVSSIGGLKSVYYMIKVSLALLIARFSEKNDGIEEIG